MSRYRLGAAAERRVRDFLERHGFEVVRAAGSKGKWDLVAWKVVGRRLILLCLQVKKRRPPSVPSLATDHASSATIHQAFVFAHRGYYLAKGVPLTVLWERRVRAESAPSARAARQSPRQPTCDRPATRNASRKTRRAPKGSRLGPAKSLAQSKSTRSDGSVRRRRLETSGKPSSKPKGDG
jgi:Holliday junction resolvase-like predicted endonuclease